MSPRHGSPVRGLSNVPRSSIRDQRFGRLFRDLPPADFGDKERDIVAALTELGMSMLQDPQRDSNGALDTTLGTISNDENPTIPAAYTYFGQFVDHDLTFDPASSLDRFNDPDALQDFRTPRLDLDSVYGSGPDDQPFLYDEDGAHLLLGVSRQGGLGGFDLARNRDAAGRPRRALIGDKRNDENIIVSQLHATIIRFHNAVLDRIAPGGNPTPREFLAAQRTVRWHYQWIVLHDFLKRIVGDETYEQIIVGPGQTPELDLYSTSGRYAFIPVEFSVAAYRYGHSQVRSSYTLNHIVGARPAGNAKAIPTDNDGSTGIFFRIPIFSAANALTAVGKTPDELVALELANLNGFRELPDFWVIDWGFFLPDVAPVLAPDGITLPQHSFKIDTELVDPLRSLPDHVGQPVPRRALSVLNLLRGWRFDLPSGQSVARFLNQAPIADDVLFSHDKPSLDARRKALFAKFKPILAGNAPLWFYLLKEAELEGGSHLGPVGGKIVAEVIAGLILADGQSFLSQEPGWMPTLPAKTPGSFTLSDLVNIAIGQATA
ncbi:heme peroxidase family protein [Mesorhizobium sp. BR1-1-16]|uniref:peroxidase family protein n=1 Tax=Mesorhizobium sp. BR1-1-16 TaxID=2876653 RepID=UPI001CCA92EA|nr:heme peroxidase family protein [Mesorhizobium sp. BR1-1-16]MBZ9938252.1 heme peroxidase family protein [Mesorhizobium sp. BR1-1-16]